jgi:hypothetical protein
MDKSKIVATSDGGVVVLIGNKLMKYDKDLVLTGESEIKIDMQALRKSMMEQMEQCPMKEKSAGQAQPQAPEAGKQ